MTDKLSKYLEKLWWISQPEAHSFYLKGEEYNKIQEWYHLAENMDKSVLIWGIDILGEPHPTHAICRLYDADNESPLGNLDHPVFKKFPYLKDVRQELKDFKHE